MKILGALVLVLVPSLASAQSTGDEHGRVDRFADPTGGAFIPPTTLFVPAAALPTLNVRVLTGVDLQPTGRFDPVRPMLGAELGLGRGFTVGAGTNWFGGDSSSALNNLTPYAQLRYQILGSASGTGPFLGAALTYKRVGYQGGANEVEASVSFHYRQPRWEIGAQGTFGQSLESGDEHDVEARVFAALRPIPRLAVGVAAQVRGDVGNDATEGPAFVAYRRANGINDFDALGGAIANFTIDRWQFGTLIGASSLGIYQSVGFLAQASGSVRF